MLYEADFILFLTGHSTLWGNLDYFLNFPVVSHEVVEWINRRRLKGIGIDAPSFDPVNVGEAEQTIDELRNHRAILKTNHTVLLENLCKLEDIGNELFMLYALPLNTLNADGAPARIIATIK
jgi:kynurenine formamidase